MRGCRGALERPMSLQVSLVEIPLLSPFSNSLGTTTKRKALILRLVNGRIEAFSECVTDDDVSCTGEDNAGAVQVITRVLGSMIRGRPPSPEEFVLAARGVRGHTMAKAAIEMLLWDYKAKADGLPLDESLGDSRGYAEAGIALGLGPPHAVESWIKGALDQRYKRVKVKIDRRNPLARLRQIRRRFPDIPLCADANGCFGLRRDQAILKGIDRFELEYLEQPLAFGDLRGHSRLAKTISTPICLDESVVSPSDAREAIELEAARVINVKPGRVGGLTAAMEIIRTAREAGVHVWVGGMLETGVGRAFNVALASQRKVDLPGDTSPNERYFARDLVRNPFKMRRGVVTPNDGPGIGALIDRRFLARATTKTWEIF